MIPAKTFDRAISNIKYRLGKYYVTMGLTLSPQVRICRDFSNPPLPRDPYVVNEWPLKAILNFHGYISHRIISQLWYVTMETIWKLQSALMGGQRVLLNRTLNPQICLFSKRTIGSLFMTVC